MKKNVFLYRQIISVKELAYFPIQTFPYNSLKILLLASSI